MLVWFDQPFVWCYQTDGLLRRIIYVRFIFDRGQAVNCTSKLKDLKECTSLSTFHDNFRLGSFYNEKGPSCGQFLKSGNMFSFNFMFLSD